jgi:hypothetical protein
MMRERIELNLQVVLELHHIMCFMTALKANSKQACRRASAANSTMWSFSDGRNENLGSPSSPPSYQTSNHNHSANCQHTHTHTWRTLTGYAHAKALFEIW